MSTRTKAALIAAVAFGLSAVAAAPATAAPSGEVGVLGGCSVWSPNTPSIVGNQIAGSALWDCLTLGSQEAAKSYVKLFQDGNVVSEHEFWTQGAFRTTYTIGFVCTGSGTHTYYSQTYGWDTNGISYIGGESAEVTLTC